MSRKSTRNNANIDRTSARARNDSAKNVTLATIIADIHADNKNATITSKKARVRLRREFASSHDRNDAWVFARKDYARIRSMFDAKFAASNAKPARARRAKNATPATTEPVA